MLDHNVIRLLYLLDISHHSFNSLITSLIFFCCFSCGENIGRFTGDIPYNGLSKQSYQINEYDRFLWDKTVKLYLNDNLWNDNEMYDAGHSLMVPLHAAFLLHNEDWQHDFFVHFTRFMNEDHSSFISSNEDSDLSREHYLYLASRFLILAAQRNRQELVPIGLVERLQREIEILWKEKPAWWYEPRYFQGGISERLQWKLRQTETQFSYYRAITDHEMFLFAIAADLRTYEILTKPKGSWNKINTDILEMAYKVLKQRIVYIGEGGMLFQPGVWRDHPDYIYAGNNDKKLEIPQCPIADISEDSSHSHRWPVWLISVGNAYDKNDQHSIYYHMLKKKLEYQFYNKVLVKPTADFPCWRVVNFMDGRNGIYRWNYETCGNGNGYGPYELSGILIEGWWGLLGTERLRLVYWEISHCFPLADSVIHTYTGPNTSRERNILTKWPDFFMNGFGELNVRLASKMIIQ